MAQTLHRHEPCVFSHLGDGEVVGRWVVLADDARPRLRAAGIAKPAVLLAHLHGVAQRTHGSDWRDGRGDMRGEGGERERERKIEREREGERGWGERGEWERERGRGGREGNRC